MPDYEFEELILSKGYKYVCGVDEAGRGPLAGPVSAAAVILPLGLKIEGLNDSKKLTEKKRNLLFDVIIEKAIAFSIAFATVEEIEENNILNATFLAMNRSIKALKVEADYALIDGNRLPNDIAVPASTIIKGDSKSMSIAAASVLAKVSRDSLMCKIDSEYPQYSFAVHKGYGTAVHTAAIREFGPCKVHRLSFLSKIL